MDKKTVSKNEDKWEVEGLLRRAFQRTKERFLTFFLAMVLVWVISVLVIFGLMIVGTILGLIAFATKIPILIGVVIGILVLIGLVAMFYMMAWAGLAYTQIIIQKEKINLSGAFKTVKPLVWNYLGIQLMILLFFIGLAPFVGLTLGIVMFLWSFWAAFVTFVYLENPQKGMANLWYSRALVNQKFWGIAGRMLLVIVVLFFVQMTAVFMGTSIPLIRFVSYLVSFIGSPFILSYYYEMYKNLDAPTKVERPTGWIVASIIGWLLMILIFVFSFSALVSNLPQMMQDWKTNMHSVSPAPLQYRDGNPVPTTDNSYQL